jgi:hypothetical protein
MQPKEPLSPYIPKTLELFLESPPPEYLVNHSADSRSKLRQLQAAFEDNIASNIDWARITSLRSSSFGDCQLKYCLESPMMVDGVPVYVLGITHSSDHSAEHVSQAIEKLNPSVVCLESCVDRTHARRCVQLPLVEKYKGDWSLITALDEDPKSPSLEELARHGLLDGSMEQAQFMIASGSIQGCPELTALYEAKMRNISVESIDVLESVKIVQNASIDAFGYSSKRQGDLSEGVLRQIVDEEGILAEYFRLMYGSTNIPNIQPSLLYRLVESRKRSGPFADLLLRELHRMYRNKQYWSRILLRDLYMSLRIRRLAASSPNCLLAIVGGAHVEGIRQILANPPDLPTHAALGLSVLIDSAEILCEVWRSVLGLEMFSSNLPRHVDNAELKCMRIAESVIGGGDKKVSVWVPSVAEWQVIELKHGSEDVNVTGVGTINILKALVDGLVDPYTVTRVQRE